MINIVPGYLLNDHTHFKSDFIAQMLLYFFYCVFFYRPLLFISLAFKIFLCTFFFAIVLLKQLDFSSVGQSPLQNVTREMNII